MKGPLKLTEKWSVNKVGEMDFSEDTHYSRTLTRPILLGLSKGCLFPAALLNNPSTQWHDSEKSITASVIS